MEVTKGYSTRLAALQRLVSDVDDSFPNALLIVPGVDGRNSKGSITMLKYLFEGASGQDLFDGGLSESLECLEEIVLLIQQTSVSVVCTREMKAVLASWLGELCLGTSYVEYLSGAQQGESSVESLQQRKFTNFKRMMLESVPAGRGVGIPIPLGYHDAFDVESWPLFQAFALDSLVFASGFLTSRHTVVDMTEYLDILYRTVDVPCVSTAVETVRKSLLPHVEEMLSLLDCSPEQRARKSVDDVLAPLDTLFDFGLLRCVEDVNPELRPSLQLGRVQLKECKNLQQSRQNQLDDCATHCILETCEPSTGLRVCRSYFLQRGKISAAIIDTEAHVVDSVEPEDDKIQSVFTGLNDHSEGGHATRTESFNADLELARCLNMERLEILYAKLWLAYRWAVRVAFSSFPDVLDAGRYLQQVLESVLGGSDDVPLPASAGDCLGSIVFPSGLGLDRVRLERSERLTVHMDCMNSLGKVVSIDDVDDMGGVCWTYIRVSVDGISLTLEPDDDNSLGCVAVGDTFCFQNASHLLENSIYTKPLPTTLHGDAYCITHAIPYFRCFVGPGRESNSSRRIFALTRSAHMLGALGLGIRLEEHLAPVRLPALTDHPLLPSVLVTMRLYSEGFILEKLDVNCSPILVSIGAHVEQMWSIDLKDAARIATEHSHSASAEDGFMLIFKFKRWEDQEETQSAPEPPPKHDETFDNDDDYDDDSPKHLNVGRESVRDTVFQVPVAMRRNPLHNSIPALTQTAPISGHDRVFQTQYFALVVEGTSRFAPSIRDACVSWRRACRMHDVEEQKGVSRVTAPFPMAIISALVNYHEQRAFRDSTASNTLLTASCAGELEGVYIDPMIAYQLAQEARAPCGTSPLGLLGMQCSFLMSDLHRFRNSSYNQGAKIMQDGSSVASLHEKLITNPGRVGEDRIVVMIGHAGSCVTMFVEDLAARLCSTPPHDGNMMRIEVQPVILDLAAQLSHNAASGDILLDEAIVNSWRDARSVSDSVQPNSTRVIVVGVILPALYDVPLPYLLQILCACAGPSARIAVVTAIVALASLELNAKESSSAGLGREQWVSRMLEHCIVGQVANLVIALNASSASCPSMFSTFRAWIAKTNSSATVLRVNLPLARLDDRHMDIFLSAFASKNGAKADSSNSLVSGARSSMIGLAKPLSSAEAIQSAAAHYTPRFSLSVQVCRRCDTELLLENQSFKSLRSFTIIAPQVEAGLDLLSASSVVQLLQYLLPNSQTFFSPEQGWHVPKPTETKGLKRAIELAASKVLTAMQQKLERHVFEKTLQDTLRLNNLALQDCEILCVGGVLPIGRLHGEDKPNRIAAIEANSGSILLTCLPPPRVAKFAESRLTITGIMTAEQEVLIQKLVELCVFYQLPLRKPTTLKDLSSQHLLEIQCDDPVTRELPLPVGWYCDGINFWGPHGLTNCSRELRPDIDEIAMRRLEKINTEVARFNTWVVQSRNLVNL